MKYFFYSFSFSMLKVDKRKDFLAVILLLTSFSFFSSIHAQSSIPFVETWESGSFEGNGWLIKQGEGQCTIANQGLNSNRSVFFNLPIGTATGDSTTIQSPWLDATGVIDGLLVFKFDYKLVNPDSTKWPLMKVYCDYGQGWTKLHELTYNASLDWRELKSNLADAKGHKVRLMWVAMKESDNAVGQWYIDNIKVEVPGSITLFGLNGTVFNQPDDYKAVLNWNKPMVYNFGGAFSDSLINYFGLFIPEYLHLYYQYTGTGSGIFFDNTPYKGSLLSEVEFYYQPEIGFSGRSSYRVQLMDFKTRKLIGTFGPFTTSDSLGWQKHIPFNLTPIPDVDSLAVLIEPLTPYSIDKGNVDMPGVAFWENYHYNYRHSVVISLYDNSYKFIADNGELLVLLKLLTPEGKQITVDPSIYHINRWQQSLPLNYYSIASVNGSDLGWSDNDVIKGGYSYYVTANYLDGSSINSDTIMIQMPAGLGISSPSQILTNVEPNPINKKILRFSNPEFINKAVVFDLTGRCLIDITDHSALVNGIPLDGFASGPYLVRIILSDGSIIGRKFIIN
ncbi:MAG: T9SS type A sorting domain-containing protein [Sphingobacteriia bacterium]|nr:T9SS type A sorting domain-containing protein [Sphingobacteriia bacterium]